MLGLFFLGLAVAFLWGAIKELLGCLARILMLGVGVFFLIAAVDYFSSH